MVSTSRKYAFTTGKKTFYMQKHVVPLVKNIIPPLGKQYFQTKICVSNVKYCVSTIGNVSCYSQNHVFLLLGIMFPTLGKKVFTGKNMCFPYREKQSLKTKLWFPLVGDMFPLLRSVVFTDKNVFPLVGNMLPVILGSQSLNVLNYVSSSGNIIVFSTKNDIFLPLASWKTFPLVQKLFFQK